MNIALYQCRAIIGHDDVIKKLGSHIYTLITLISTYISLSVETIHLKKNLNKSEYQFAEAVLTLICVFQLLLQLLDDQLLP